MLVNDGRIATGGGLLFVGRNDGRLTALDSATGKQLWDFQTGSGMHAPVSTFEHKGQQYVTAGRSNMPPFSATFTVEQIRDVSAYVVENVAGR